MPTFNLKSKTVLITGAGSGIGYALSLAFAGEGANIVATDIAPAGLEQLKPEVELLGVQCRTALLDVTDAAAFQSLGQELAASGQLPDVLINNAGIASAKSFLDTELSDWHINFDINVYGVVNGSQTMIRLWLEHGVKAHLVNIASSVAVGPMPGMTAYSASKAATFALTESLACELIGTDIGVTTVCPGAINTSITAREGLSNYPSKQLENVRKYYREQGTAPAEVALAVVSAVKRNKSVIFVGNGAGIVNISRRFLSAQAFRNLLLKTARQLGFAPPIPTADSL